MKLKYVFYTSNNDMRYFLSMHTTTMYILVLLTWISEYVKKQRASLDINFHSADLNPRQNDQRIYIHPLI